MARIIVVGAGMGGLCCALRLAAGGHDVTICEAAPRVGGKLGRWSQNGFTFDTGPSLLTMPQVFAELFADVGERIDDHLSLVPLDPIARYRWPDGTCVDTSSEAEHLAAQFTTAMGSSAAEDWRNLMARAAAMWRAVERPILRTASRGIATFAPLVTRVRDLHRLAPLATLRDMGWRYLRDPRQRMMLDRYATYSGSDPRRAPAALVTVPYAELAFGGWYVTGGLYRLAEVIAALAAERGARIRVDTPVEQVATSGSAVRGVRLSSGEFLRADAVVSNVDARALYGAGRRSRRAPGLPAKVGSLTSEASPAEPGMVRGVAGSLARRGTPATRAPGSSSGFVLLLGLGGTTPGLASHNVLFPTDYDAEFDALFGVPARPVENPTIYLHRPVDPSSSPPGCESWFVLVNAPQHGRPPGARRRHRLSGGDRSAVSRVDWNSASLVDTYSDHLLRLLADRGFDIRERIRVRRALSPADLERSTGAPGGAIYGSSSNGPAAAFLRAPNRSPVRGLFLVGGSAHPGGGLPLVALSAAMVADLLDGS